MKSKLLSMQLGMKRPSGDELQKQLSEFNRKTFAARTYIGYASIPAHYLKAGRPDVLARHLDIVTLGRGTRRAAELMKKKPTLSESEALKEAMKPMISSLMTVVGGVLAIGDTLQSMVFRQRAMIDKAYSKELGGIGKLSRGFDLFGAVSRLWMLPIIALALSGKGITYSGLMATIGKTIGIGYLPLTLGFGIGSLLTNIRKFRKLSSITVAQRTADAEVRKASKSNQILSSVNFSELSSQFELANLLLLGLIEKHVSVLPGMWSLLNYENQLKTKGKKVSGEYTRQLTEFPEKEGLITRLLDRLTYSITSFTYKYNPLEQLFTWIFQKKKPREVLLELKTSFGIEDRKLVKEEKKRMAFLGSSISTVRLLSITPREVLSTETDPVVSLLSWIGMIQRAHLVEAITMRKTGFGVYKTIEVEQEFKKSLTKKFVESLVNKISNVPGLSAIYNIAAAPFKIGEFIANKIKDIPNTLFGTFSDYLRDPRKLLERAGLRKSDAERSTQYLAYGLPEVQEEIRSLIEEQLIVQKDTYGLLADYVTIFTRGMYRPTPSAKIPSLKKWSPTVGKYLYYSPEEAVEQRKIKELRFAKGEVRRQEEDERNRILSALEEDISKSLFAKLKLPFDFLFKNKTFFSEIYEKSLVDSAIRLNDKLEEFIMGDDAFIKEASELLNFAQRRLERPVALPLEQGRTPFLMARRHGRFMHKIRGMAPGFGESAIGGLLGLLLFGPLGGIALGGQALMRQKAAYEIFKEAEMDRAIEEELVKRPWSLYEIKKEKPKESGLFRRIFEGLGLVAKKPELVREVRKRTSEELPAEQEKPDQVSDIIQKMTTLPMFGHGVGEDIYVNKLDRIISKLDLAVSILKPIYIRIRDIYDILTRIVGPTSTEPYFVRTVSPDFEIKDKSNKLLYLTHNLDWEEKYSREIKLRSYADSYEKAIKAAEGLIVPPKPGGTRVIVGEGKEAEIIAPMSKFNRLLETVTSIFTRRIKEESRRDVNEELKEVEEKKKYAEEKKWRDSVLDVLTNIFSVSKEKIDKKRQEDQKIGEGFFDKYLSDFFKAIGKLLGIGFLSKRLYENIGIKSIEDAREKIIKVLYAINDFRIIKAVSGLLSLFKTPEKLFVGLFKQLSKLKNLFFGEESIFTRIYRIIFSVFSKIDFSKITSPFVKISTLLTSFFSKIYSSILSLFSKIEFISPITKFIQKIVGLFAGKESIFSKIFGAISSIFSKLNFAGLISSFGKIFPSAETIQKLFSPLSFIGKGIVGTLKIFPALFEGVFSVFTKVGGILSKILKLPLINKLPVIGNILMAIDAASGFFDAENIFGIKNVTSGQRISAAIGKVLSGLSFGYLTTERASKGIYDFGLKLQGLYEKYIVPSYELLKSGFFNIYEKTSEVFSFLSREVFIPLYAAIFNVWQEVSPSINELSKVLLLLGGKLLDFAKTVFNEVLTPAFKLIFELGKWMGEKFGELLKVILPPIIDGLTSAIKTGADVVSKVIGVFNYIFEELAKFSKFLKRIIPSIGGSMDYASETALDIATSNLRQQQQLNASKISQPLTSFTVNPIRSQKSQMTELPFGDPGVVPNIFTLTFDGIDYSKVKPSDISDNFVSGDYKLKSRVDEYLPVKEIPVVPKIEYKERIDRIKEEQRPTMAESPQPVPPDMLIRGKEETGPSSIEDILAGFVGDAITGIIDIFSLAKTSGKGIFDNIISFGSSVGDRIKYNIGLDSFIGRKKAAMDFFINRGWTPEQAAGIVGNLIHESGGKLDPSAKDGTGSIGLAQWKGSRLDDLKRFAASKGKPFEDFQTQLEFVQYELETSEAVAGRALKAAGTVEDAARIFSEKYERPSIPMIERRIDNARKILVDYQSGKLDRSFDLSSIVGGSGNLLNRSKADLDAFTRSTANCGDAVAHIVNSIAERKLLPSGGLDSGSIISAGRGLGVPVVTGSNVDIDTIKQLGEGTVIRYDRTPDNINYRYGRDHAEIVIKDPTSGELLIYSPSGRGRSTLKRLDQSYYVNELSKTRNIVASNLLLGGTGAPDFDSAGIDIVKFHAPKLSFVPPVEGKITSVPGDDRIYRRGIHTGLDISAMSGTPVKSVSIGRVLGIYENRPDTHTGWGVAIQHPDGVITRYFHMRTRPNVKEGEFVEAGDVIGSVGNTGGFVGMSPHLHFETLPSEISTGSVASYLNPLDVYPALRKFDFSVGPSGRPLQIEQFNKELVEYFTKPAEQIQESFSTSRSQFVEDLKSAIKDVFEKISETDDLPVYDINARRAIHEVGTRTTELMNVLPEMVKTSPDTSSSLSTIETSSPIVESNIEHLINSMLKNSAIGFVEYSKRFSSEINVL